jgi:hypothetical protein
MGLLRPGVLGLALALVACATAQTEPSGNGGDGGIGGAQGGAAGSMAGMGGEGGTPTCQCVAPPNAMSTCVDDVCGFSCNRGFFDCNGRGDDGCEVSGLCPVLASGLVFPYDVAVHDGIAYVAVAANLSASGGYILQVSLTDGTSSTLVGGEWAPRSVAVSDDHVYWANSFGPNGPNDGRIRRIPIAGGGTDTVAFPIVHPIELTVVGPEIVWGEQGAAAMSPGGVWHAALDGSVAAAKVTTTIDFVATIDAQPSTTYWAAVLPNQMQALQAVDMATGAQTTIASGFATAMTSDGTNFYFSTPGAIRVVPLAGGTPTDLVLGVYNAVDLEIDGATLYFADKGQSNQSNGAVKKCDLSGQNVQTIAADQPGPYALTVSGSEVYWVDSDAGTLSHAPK